MRKLIMISIATLLSCCNTKKGLEEPLLISNKSICPENGKCTTEVFKNKQLDVKSDEFGSTYYQMSDAKQTTVIVYRYKRNPIKNVEDGNYTEEIIFEIDNSASKLILTDNDLQQTKMIFGRLCFCRGQTGYYKVQTGNLKLQQTKNEIQFDLDFKINQVPQVINSISEVVK